MRFGKAKTHKHKAANAVQASSTQFVKGATDIEDIEHSIFE
jgi:hypothetical protein